MISPTASDDNNHAASPSVPSSPPLVGPVATFPSEPEGTFIPKTLHSTTSSSRFSFTAPRIGSTSALQSQWYIRQATKMGLHKREPLFLGLWVAWLLTGALYYSYSPDFELGFIKGFYMAINIGYSIGFGHPLDENTNSIWFSTLYVLVGSSFVGVALGFFAEKITEDSESWFSRLQDQKKIQDFILLGNDNWKGQLQAWLYHQRSALKSIGLWLLLIASLTIISMYGVGWTFREAQYFAFTTLSTGGHWAIPVDAPDWLYLVTALITMVGVPIMGLAMAAIGQAMMDQGDLEEAKTAIDDKVTKEELQLLEDLGLQDGDGELDMSEFILLCMVRIGTDPSLLSYIRQRFIELSKEKDYVTIEDVTERTCTYSNGQIRHKESVIEEKPPGGIFPLEGIPPSVEEEEEENSCSDGSTTHETTQNGNNSEGGTEVDTTGGNTEEESHILPSSIPETRIGTDQEGGNSKDTVSEMKDGNLEEELQQSTQNIVVEAAPEHDLEANMNDSGAAQGGDDQSTTIKTTQPKLIDDGKARPLKRGDDFGMALLDRNYVMSLEEEKQVLKEARRRFKLLVKESVKEEGWSSHRKIGGTKVSSKEGVGGSLNNMIRGVTEIEHEHLTIDFAAAQTKYELRSEDAFDHFYRALDPTAMRTAILSRIRHRELLDEEAREECLILWAAIKAPLGLVSDRDVCVVMHSRKGICPITEEPVFVINFFSIVHPSVPDMEKALNRIRGEVSLGGYILRRSKTQKNTFGLVNLVQYDPKGKVPSRVVNAFAISQGLNVGRLRALFYNHCDKGVDLTGLKCPVGWYTLRRLGSVVHDLQLLVLDDDEGSRFLHDATRTFKLDICACAKHPVSLRLLTSMVDDNNNNNNNNGLPPQYSFGRAKGCDSATKKLAGGKSVTFGGSGNSYFRAMVFLTVEGPLPEVIQVKFLNSFWQKNEIFIASIAQLSETGHAAVWQGLDSSGCSREV